MPPTKQGNSRVTRLALKTALRSDIVRLMQIKSHTKWAMALCAVAVFSLTSIANAELGSISGGSDSVVDPAPTGGNQTSTFGVTPVPPAPTSSEAVSSGTFTGTIMAD